MLLPIQAMDLFDMGDGFPSLQEGVARVQCPVLVRLGQPPGATSGLLHSVTLSLSLSPAWLGPGSQL